MAKNGGKLDDEIDDLFQLPVAEFTGARNELAARLKKQGLKNESDRVKLLSKPSVTAWAVNQLHWHHRDAFEELIDASQRVHSGKAMRESLDARRDALVKLSELATELLQEAGHNPGQDTIRRITSSLEALSTYALLPDGPEPGRLSNDVDPPSFELLAALMSGGPVRERTAPRAKPDKGKTDVQQKAADARRLEATRQAKIGAAKTSLQDAKRALSEARTNAESLEAAHKKAIVDAKDAERSRREAAARLEKATAAAEEATQNAQDLGAEANEATKTVAEAKRTVEKTTKELEALLREPLNHR